MLRVKSSGLGGRRSSSSSDGGSPKVPALLVFGVSVVSIVAAAFLDRKAVV